MLARKIGEITFVAICVILLLALAVGRISFENTLLLGLVVVVPLIAGAACSDPQSDAQSDAREVSTPMKVSEVSPVPSAVRIRPMTGVIKSPVGGRGRGEITVRNGTSGDGLVILSTRAEESVASIYIRSDDSYRLVSVPDGTYFLFFSTGEEWDSNAGRFANNARYQRFTDEFDFNTTSRGYSIWEVTLHGVIGGDAGSISVDEDEFPSAN